MREDAQTRRSVKDTVKQAFAKIRRSRAASARWAKKRDEAPAAAADTQQARKRKREKGPMGGEDDEDPLEEGTLGDGKRFRWTATMAVDPEAREIIESEKPEGSVITISPGKSQEVLLSWSGQLGGVKFEELESRWGAEEEEVEEATMEAADETLPV